jgi:hypothetical protein
MNFIRHIAIGSRGRWLFIYLFIFVLFLLFFFLFYFSRSIRMAHCMGNNYFMSISMLTLIDMHGYFTRFVNLKKNCKIIQRLPKATQKNY